MKAVKADAATKMTGKKDKKMAYLFSKMSVPKEIFKILSWPSIKGVHPEYGKKTSGFLQKPKNSIWTIRHSNGPNYHF